MNIVDSPLLLIVLYRLGQQVHMDIYMMVLRIRKIPIDVFIDVILYREHL